MQSLFYSFRLANISIKYICVPIINMTTFFFVKCFVSLDTSVVEGWQCSWKITWRKQDTRLRSVTFVYYSEMIRGLRGKICVKLEKLSLNWGWTETFPITHLQFSPTLPLSKIHMFTPSYRVLWLMPCDIQHWTLVNDPVVKDYPHH